MTKKEKEIWNRAVDACIALLILHFIAPNEPIGIIEKAKK